MATPMPAINKPEAADGGDPPKNNVLNQGQMVMGHRIPMLATASLNKGAEGELQRDYHKDEQNYR